MVSLKKLDIINHRLGYITFDIYMTILNKYNLNLLSDKIDISYFVLNSIKSGLYEPSDLIIKKLIHFEEKITGKKINISLLAENKRKEEEKIREFLKEYYKNNKNKIYIRNNAKRYNAKRYFSLKSLI